MKSRLKHWNKLALIALVAVVSACAKNEMPDEGEEAGEYFVTMTVNGQRVDYKSGIRASLSAPPHKSMGVNGKRMGPSYRAETTENDAPSGNVDYQQFMLIVEGAGSIKGSYALSLNCFVYEPWQTGKKYQTTFEPDENGNAGKQHQVDIQYLSEALASQYLHVMNDTFETGSAHVVLKEVTSTFIKGTFYSVMTQGALPYMTEQGNVAKLGTPMVIEGEFYAPIK